jgi:hypothetical protein
VLHLYYGVGHVVRRRDLHPFLDQDDRHLAGYPVVEHGMYQLPLAVGRQGAYAVDDHYVRPQRQHLLDDEVHRRFVSDADQVEDISRRLEAGGG